LALNLTELLLADASAAATAGREGVDGPDAVADWAFAVADVVDSRACDLLGAMVRRGGVES
jgi:hypothetical protein